MKLTFLASLYIKNPKLLPIHIERKVHVIEDLPTVHQHDFYEMVYFVHGRAVHYFEGKEYEVHTGDIMLIRPGEHHTFMLDVGQQIEIINCLFLPDMFEKRWLELLDQEGSISSFLMHPFLNKREEFHPRLSLSKSESRRMERVLEEMLTEYEEKRAYSPLLIRLKMFELIHVMIRCYEEEQQREKQVSTHQVTDRLIMIRRMQQYLEENYEQKLDIEMIAKSYGISARHLNRVFKEDTGMTLTEMNHHIRIEKAKQLLLQTNERVIDIAGKVGYEDPSFFSKLFVRKVKCSPGNYREQNK